MRKTFAIAGLLASLVASADYDTVVWSEDWEENVDIGFSYCDRDEDGTVSYKEFIKCSRGFGTPEEKLEREFLEMDLDGDQKIDYDEAYLVSKRKYGPQPTYDNFDAIFEWMDDDNSNSLSWREFKSCWTALWASWDYQML